MRCAFDVVARSTNATADTVYLGRDFPRDPQPGYWVWLFGQTEPLRGSSLHRISAGARLVAPQRAA